MGLPYGDGVAVIYHFETMEAARRMMDRIDALGGMSATCVGHIWDEEEMLGWVVADTVDGTILSLQSHIAPEGAYAALMDHDGDPDIVPDVYALLDASLMSSEECAGWVEEDGEEDVSPESKAARDFLRSLNQQEEADE